MTEGRGPDERAAADGEPESEPAAEASAGGRVEPEPTRAIDLGDATQPVDLGDATQPVDVAAPRTGPFARRTPPSRPIDLVSSTGANRLLAPPAAERDPTSGIDTLFADARFRDYEEPPPPRYPAAPPEHHLTRTQRTLLAVMGGLLALVALVGLFLIGTRLGAEPDAAPSAHRTATPAPTPVPTVLPPGPVAVGVHRWDQLLGGECLGAYPGPWAQTYTVVDCAAAHPAQMVYRGRFPDPATPGYPGEAALRSQMAVLCSAPGVIDLAAASHYTDAQIEASYPATAAQWNAGDHWYYCFVSRSSKDPLTGSVAVAHPETPAP